MFLNPSIITSAREAEKGFPCCTGLMTAQCGEQKSGVIKNIIMAKNCFSPTKEAGTVSLISK